MFGYVEAIAVNNLNAAAVTFILDFQKDVN